ncbi:hypothetical protein JVT61DRAFT_12205 [Boletus reticuloceps]|uniref:E3 ubiquitin-protein ligase n=1 Tax=Boletus reticuloceps TaxID=495285 RepID=A0A8I3A3T2_9AGAM|nr:hypothetical protein JVT61DRAFT_12205 [Boletus reticuloceps]
MSMKPRDLPGSRKYVFTPATRVEILSELYDVSGAHTPTLPPSLKLQSPHARHARPSLGRKSDSQAQVQKNPSFHVPAVTSSPKAKAVSDRLRPRRNMRSVQPLLPCQLSHGLFIAQQCGGYCDCGDAEIWRQNIHVPSIHSSTTPIPPLPLLIQFQESRRELREYTSRTIAYALDFLLETLDCSPNEPSMPSNKADLHLRPTADSMQKDQYTVIIWNNDIPLTKSFNSSATPQTAIAMKLPRWPTPTTNTASLRSSPKSRSVSPFGARTTPSEQILVVIIKWFLDLTRSRLGSDALIIREVITAQLLSPRPTDEDANRSASHILDLLRLPVDWMFLHHTRLWKKPRISLNEIYASVLTLSHPHKLAIGSHFATMHPCIMDACLLVDWEAETFALQLFTVPSVAGRIVRYHNLVTHLLDIINNFFMNQIVNKRMVDIPEAPPRSQNWTLTVSHCPFGSKRSCLSLATFGSKSEDGTVEIWNSNMYRSENTLGYALESAWCVVLRRDANEVAVEFDEGIVAIKLDLDEPMFSMDPTGKLIYTCNQLVLSGNVQSLAEDTTSEGNCIPLLIKELGTTGIFATNLFHS